MKSESEATGDSGPSALLALQRATHATLHHLAAGLAGLDLTASEVNALANLADGRARTVSELGAAVGTKPTTLTGVLDRLEKRGLVTRAARPGDRRSVLIAPTAEGLATAATIRATIGDLEARALHAVRPEDIAGFFTVVRALTEADS